MTAEIIDGHKHAQILLDNVAGELDHLSRAPGLAVVLVGDDPASHIYVRSKIRRGSWACAARRKSCRVASPKASCFPSSRR